MTNNTTPPPYRTSKLELSPFDGSEPLEWLFQADQFFTFYQIPIESRLSMSSFYMKGDALSWFKWMYQNHQLFDWNSFTKALKLRFGPSTYANHQAELFKLRQTGSISECQAQFEKLGNRVIGLPADALLNCFISGLNTEICNEMAIQRPTTITQAIGLAKLIEAKCKDYKPRPPKPLSQSSSSSYSRPQSSNTNNMTPPNTPTALYNPLPTLPKPNSSPPTNTQSNASVKPKSKNAEPLAFATIVKKIHTGHKWSTGRFLLLMVDDKTEPLDQPDLPLEPEQPDEPPPI